MRRVLVWVGWTFAASFCLLLFGGAAVSAGLPQKAYDVVRVADDVYAFLWRDPVADPIEGNALFVINDRDVLVVDSGFYPSTARVMAAELRKLTAKPVRYVVHTHWHDDHHGGNQVYRELWPQVEFIAQRDTRADMFSGTYERRPQDIENVRGEAARFQRWLAEGKDDAGTVLTEARRERVVSVASWIAAAAEEMTQIRPTPPELTFTEELVLHRGERTIEIRWLGRGNTRGDTVIFLPKERVAAIGDLVVLPIPFGFGSYYEDWIDTLGKLDALGADVLVPGHGGLHRDRQALRRMQDLLRDLVAQVKAAVAAGATLEETQRRVTLEDWKKKFTADNPALAPGFDVNFVQPAVERMWRQAKGEPDKPTGF